jgi:hypothetical protein
MSKRIRLIPSILAVLLVITLASLSLSGPMVHAASSAVDQQCSAIGGSYLDGVGVHQPAGQTFIPTQSSMVGIALHLWSDNLASTSMTANIISNGIAGVNGIQGSQVGSVTFDVPPLFGQPTGDWLNVQLPSGIVLAPGAVYALNLVDNSGSGGVKWSACSTPYTNGCGYANGQCQAYSWSFIDYYGDFSVAFSTTGISIAQGASGSVNLYVASLNNFASPVAVTFSAPAGVTASFNGPSRLLTSAGGTTSPTLTIFVSGTVAPGTYPFTVTTSSGGISHSATLQLIVTPSSTVIASSNPDFITQPSPATMTLTPGVSKATTVAVSSVNGFSSSVSLTASWTGVVPSGVTISLPSPVNVPAGGTASAVLTLTADNSPSTGSYALIVAATYGVISHSTQIMVTIAGTPSVLAPVVVPDFAVRPSSGSVSVIQGLGAGTSVIVSSFNGFSSPVTFSASWVGNAPTGIAITVPQSVTPAPGGEASSPIGFTTTSTGSTGSFVVQVAGTSGSVTHATDITLQVNSVGPQCIIATATYGSSVAPQVQLLRNFRDDSILKTKAGSNFMIAFNAWYYSFSPPVANYIANNWAARTTMQALLYPMVGILGVSYGVFNAGGTYPELAIVLAGVMASGMLGALYLGLPAGVVRGRIKRFRTAKLGGSLEKTLIGASIASGSALAIAELTASPLALMITSSALVLSTLLLASTATSNRIARLVAGGRMN